MLVVTGTLTPQMHASFSKPQLLVMTDPMAAYLPLMEASHFNFPAIACAICSHLW